MRKSPVSPERAGLMQREWCSARQLTCTHFTAGQSRGISTEYQFHELLDLCCPFSTIFHKQIFTFL